MACRGKKPCACRDCGPFMISGLGKFRTLEGEELPYEIETRKPRGERAREGWRRRFPGAARGEALGTRLHRQWTPASDVGLPTADRSRFGALGSMLEADPANATGGVPLGSGGNGVLAPRPRSEQGLPIGAMASVPARIGVNFERIGRPAEITREPYGMLPLEASLEPPPGVIGSPYVEAAGSGVLPQGAAGDLRLVEPYRQYVPPLPASQNLCIVNGFDPRWGEPPRTYQGVVMRFDYAKGAYMFDAGDPNLALAFKQSHDPRLVRWFQDMSRRYASGSMLQPYKPEDGTGQWAFRWIPRRQEVVCV